MLRVLLPFAAGIVALYGIFSTVVLIVIEHLVFGTFDVLRTYVFCCTMVALLLAAVTLVRSIYGPNVRAHG